MNFGRLLVILVDRRVFRQPSSLDFGGLRLRLSFGWSCSNSLASSHFYTCFRLVFPLALAFLVDLLRVSTFFVFRIASGCDLLRLDLSTSFRVLAVNSLSGLIIFRMLGAYLYSSGMLISARWVHPSPLDFCVVKCTLDFHSGISRRVILVFERCCSADDLSPLIGIVAQFRTGRLP